MSTVIDLDAYREKRDLEQWQRIADACDTARIDIQAAYTQLFAEDFDKHVMEGMKLKEADPDAAS